MKLIQRFSTVLVVLIAAFAVVAAAGVANFKADANDTNIDLNIDQNISQDTDMQMLENPNRGFGPEMIVCDSVVGGRPCTDSKDDWGTYRYHEIYDMMNTFKGSTYADYDKPKTVYLRMLAESYADKSSFDQEFLDRVNTVFSILREYNVKAVFRLAFNWEQAVEPSVDNARGLWQSLKSTLEANKDAILVIQAGTVCGWSEWTKSCAKNHDLGAIYRIVLDNTPKDIDVEHQYVDFVTPNWTAEDAARDAYHSDHFIGEFNMGDSITWKGHDMTKMKTSHPLTSLNSMETWWGCNLYEAGYKPKSPIFEPNTNDMELRFLNFAGRMAQTRTTVLDFTHAYLVYQIGSADPWKDNAKCNSSVTNPEKFTLDRYKHKNLQVVNGRITEGNFPYASSGSSITAFEYIRDYLGYRLKITDGNMKVANSKVDISIDLKNYGFAQPFRMTSGFAVINADTNKVVSTSNLPENTSEGWIPYSSYDAITSKGFALCTAAITGEWCKQFKSMKQRDLLTHKVSATLDLPKEHGNYYIGFYLKDYNANPNFATFANDLKDVDGVKILDPSAVIKI
ncbi:MAG: DUF4874 domain-containing protein [Bifidobacteriaceae bacterium]|jgi:hypothetical protein|nr:DUF4874 domain-containing protein [Bifidobacteriaceae bacterium]